MSNTEKNLNKTLETIRKKYGNSSIIQSDADFDPIEVIPTPSIQLNKAIGAGGFPRGRMTEVFGTEGSSKSSLCAHIVAEAQKSGGICAYIDSEHSLNRDWFEKLGVNFEKDFLICQPSNGEEAIDIAEYLLKDGSCDVLIIDSIAALTPSQELDGEIIDSTIALLARLMSKAMRRLTPLMIKSNTAVIFTNQIRENPGAMGYGPKTVTPGGKAMKFYASLRIELTRTGSIKDGENIIGNTVKAKLVKNKIGMPFKEVIYDFLFTEGISQEREILELATKANILNKGGAWISYTSDSGESFKWQGSEKARLGLKENSELKEELLLKLKAIDEKL